MSHCSEYEAYFVTFIKVGRNEKEKIFYNGLASRPGLLLPLYMKNRAMSNTMMRVQIII